MTTRNRIEVINRCGRCGDFQEELESWEVFGGERRTAPQYDFMSFCTYLYGSNYENYETSIADSRIELVSEIEHHRGRDFRYIGLKDVFQSIARCANGILVDTFVPKMINNHDEDLEDENDLNSDNSENESDDSDNESNVNVTDPPLQKRQCNRMSTFGQHK